MLDGLAILACKAAGISRNTVYTHLRKDAAFRRRWVRAFERRLDAVERGDFKASDWRGVVDRVRASLRADDSRPEQTP